MKTRKKSSGAQNRKRKAEKDALLQKQADSMSLFIKKLKTTSGNDVHVKVSSELVSQEGTSSCQGTSTTMDEIIVRNHDTEEGNINTLQECINSLNPESEPKDKNFSDNCSEETGTNKNSLHTKQPEAMTDFLKEMENTSDINIAHFERTLESVSQEGTSSTQNTLIVFDAVIAGTDHSSEDGNNRPSTKELNGNSLNSDLEDKNYPDNSTKLTGINKISFINLDFDDPAKWPTLNDKVRTTLSEMGPIQKKGLIYPKDNHGRKFSDVYYNRKMENGELVPRTWLLYSVSINSVFCFCCKIFASIDSSSLVKGYNDWTNVSKALHRHETSRAHMTNFLKWKELEKNLKNKTTIDFQTQNMYEIEKKHWSNVLERLIEIIKFLGSQNLAFRGSSDVLYQKSNGNFLKLVELFAKFDPVLESHVERILRPKGSTNKVHYLSKDSQNEMLQILGSSIREKILLMLQTAKYYSIILDCTPDISKTEQMSVIIRFVLCSDGKAEIKEHFLGFIKIEDSTGSGLCERVKEMLQTWNISLDDMRGQGYDNGANMKGKNNGLQSNILKINPRAFYVPCAAHSLNLMINDAAKVNIDTVSFFSTVQELYNLFSSSVKRWAVLLKHISRLTLKALSNTRWESKIEAIRPLRYQLGEIYDALFEISEDESFLKEVQHEARSLCAKVKDYKFICSLIIWHDLLNRINPVSKQLQEESINVSLALTAINNLKTFIEEYRSDANYKSVLEKAKELSEEVDGESQFKSVELVRRRKKKCHFDYEHSDESPQSPEEKFRVNVFFSILDTAWTSLNERFDTMQSHSENFSFLSNLSEIGNANLKVKCDKLEKLLKSGDNRDVNGEDLYDEIIAFKDTFTTGLNNPLDILNLLVSNNLCFPNLKIALRILLSIPVSVASSERSFSKLKLIKTYLRSSISQERLINLALIAIEKEICQEINVKEVVEKFVSMKCRKINYSR